MKNKLKEMKGITLIALVITIIVLLILAAVSIATLTGENGILTRANTAKNRTQEAEAEEIFKLIANEWQIEKRANKNADLKKVAEGYGVNVTGNEAPFTLEYKGEKIQIDNNGVLTEVTDSSSKITWTNTSEGELAVGSTVKHIATEEEFYVIGFDGDNVKLLAKNNLKPDGSAQDNTGAINPCEFSVVDGGFTLKEDLNNNSTVKEDTTSAVYKAMQYGRETLGVTTGRLMLYSEAEELKSANSDIFYGKNGKSSGTYLNYWLGTGADFVSIYCVHGETEGFSGFYRSFE